ncbi:sensor histidine kinase [Halobaculum lipolyticum]|uniref:histidine kinase n=1 Tax=Halobaculum lipolyticum TaxID=3032001 RepID=A0ABD5WCK1_9EURY|nr:PAS domain-containing sensor histidine kinase [Halobaculum sp. DT31]
MSHPSGRGGETLDLRESLLYALADAGTFEEAVERTLGEICRAGGWEYGEAWLPEGTDRLVGGPAWTAPGYESVRAATGGETVGRGEGPVGRAWERLDTEWVRDLSAPDAAVARADAARAAGLASGVAFPLVGTAGTADGDVPDADGGVADADVADAEPIAVLEFLTATPTESEPPFARTAAAVVADLGRLFARRRAADRVAEERRLLDAVLDVTPLPVIVFDAGGEVERINAAASAVLDLDAPAVRERGRFDERWALETVDGEPLSEADRPVSRALRTGESASGRVNITLPSGDRHTIDLRAAPVIGIGGGVERVVAAFSDVTESVSYRRELEARNDTLAEFASVVSHDLRNPLAVAKGYVDLTMETGDDSHLSTAMGALDRMDELIRALLLLARSGRGVGDRRPVSLAAAAREAWANVAAGDATLVVGDDLPVVEADDVRLGQLLENLFGNAVSHGGAAPTVRVEALADGRGFAVVDDGPGIPADRREWVFEPGHSSDDDGTGLGLTVVRTIAEAHGWSVRVAATDGTAGARFEIRTAD